MKLKPCMFSLFLLLTNISWAQQAVIIRVRSEEQEDTLGVNIVREITKTTYEAIKDGYVQLWDSPKKEVAISYAALKEIEKSSALNFIDQQLVFIYEVWNNEKKKLTSETKGFLFSSKLPNGEAVLFGYVDYEPLKNKFATASPMINANGDCFLNLNNYLSRKNYNYQLLQFGNKVVDNASESKLLKEQFIGNNKFNANQWSDDSLESKYVEWTVSASDKMVGSKAKFSNDFIYSLTEYFHQNLEVLYNLSGKNAESILQNGTWKIASVSFAEVWKKKGTIINSTPLWMSVDIDSSVIDTIWMDNLVNWDFKVNDLEWLDFIQQKNFLYSVTKINSEAIPIEKSIKYQKGLFTHKWNNLINFVKLY
ncbi:MAG: hypothetical protein ACKOX3_01880 [Bacteroidota bacterium]